MTVTVEIKTGGLQRLGARAKKRSEFLTQEGLRTILRDKGEEAVAQFQQNIASLTPGPLKDLAESTKLRKAKQHGFVYPMLKATGAMMRSMFARIAGRHSQWSILVDFRGARNKEVAQRHLEGTPKMPARDFMQLPRSFRTRIIADIRAGIWRK